MIFIYSFLSCSDKLLSSKSFVNPCIELIGVFISCDTLSIKSFCNISVFPNCSTIILKLSTNSFISSSLLVSSLTVKSPSATFLVASILFFNGSAKILVDILIIAKLISIVFTTIIPIPNLNIFHNSFLAVSVSILNTIYLAIAWWVKIYKLIAERIITSIMAIDNWITIPLWIVLFAPKIFSFIYFRPFPYL